jgi:hypothetical protein
MHINPHAHCGLYPTLELKSPKPTKKGTKKRERERGGGRGVLGGGGGGLPGRDGDKKIAGIN